MSGNIYRFWGLGSRSCWGPGRSLPPFPNLDEHQNHLGRFSEIKVPQALHYSDAVRTSYCGWAWRPFCKPLWVILSNTSVKSFCRLFPTHGPLGIQERCDWVSSSESMSAWGRFETCLCLEAGKAMPPSEARNTPAARLWQMTVSCDLGLATLHLMVNIPKVSAKASLDL